MRSWAIRRSRDAPLFLRGKEADISTGSKSVHDESHGNADLVAHFFRRAFDLLRRQGTFGLIATNTIGQGDTRSTASAGSAPTAVRSLQATPSQEVAGTGGGHRQCRPRCQGADCEALTGSTERDVPLHHRVPFPRGRPRRPKEDPGQHSERAFKEPSLLGTGFRFDDTNTKECRRQSVR